MAHEDRADRRAVDRQARLRGRSRGLSRIGEDRDANRLFRDRNGSERQPVQLAQPDQATAESYAAYLESQGYTDVAVVAQEEPGADAAAPDEGCSS